MMLAGLRYLFDLVLDGQQGVTRPRLPHLPHTWQGVNRYHASHILEKAPTILKMPANVAKYTITVLQIETRKFE